MVPWSGPAGEKCSLAVKDGEQQKKQCTGERNEQPLSLPSLMPDEYDETRWGEFFEEWEDEPEGSQDMTKGQLTHETAN